MFYSFRIFGVFTTKKFYMNLLHYACSCCSFKIVKFLLSLKVFDLHAKDNKIFNYLLNGV